MNISGTDSYDIIIAMIVGLTIGSILLPPWMLFIYWYGEHGHKTNPHGNDIGFYLDGYSLSFLEDNIFDD